MTNDELDWVEQELRGVLVDELESKVEVALGRLPRLVVATMPNGTSLQLLGALKQTCPFDGDHVDVPGTEVRISCRPYGDYFFALSTNVPHVTFRIATENDDQHGIAVAFLAP